MGKGLRQSPGPPPVSEWLPGAAEARGHGKRHRDLGWASAEDGDKPVVGMSVLRCPAGGLEQEWDMEGRPAGHCGSRGWERGHSRPGQAGEMSETGQQCGEADARPLASRTRPRTPALGVLGTSPPAVPGHSGSLPAPGRHW